MKTDTKWRLGIDQKKILDKFVKNGSGTSISNSITNAHVSKTDQEVSGEIKKIIWSNKLMWIINKNMINNNIILMFIFL